MNVSINFHYETSYNNNSIKLTNIINLIVWMMDEYLFGFPSR